MPTVRTTWVGAPGPVHIFSPVERVEVLRGEKAPDDALARELGAMGLL